MVGIAIFNIQWGFIPFKCNTVTVTSYTHQSNEKCSMKKIVNFSCVLFIIIMQMDSYIFSKSESFAFKSFSTGDDKTSFEEEEEETDILLRITFIILDLILDPIHCSAAICV